jgi:zinc/manganese transport system permease protein
MFEVLVFMAPAICMCLILVAICGYVGVHVIMREVIFIDISLAQISALGASVSLLIGLELGEVRTCLISLAVTFLGAVLLSSTGRLKKIVPQEAFIGILYAVGSAGTLLVGDRLAHGSEHVKELMYGHLLWTNWKEIGFHCIVYACLGLVYWLIHAKLLVLSEKKDHGKKGKRGDVWWEFLFYALLGVLVTFAVRVAGVLLVFGFLIVPAAIGTLLVKSFFGRLIVGWVTGILVSILGTYLSYVMDFPTGAVIVVSLGLCLLVIAFLKAMLLKRARVPVK